MSIKNILFTHASSTLNIFIPFYYFYLIVIIMCAAKDENFIVYLLPDILMTAHVNFLKLLRIIWTEILTHFNGNVFRKHWKQQSLL